MVHPASPDSLALESFLAQLEAAGIPPSFRARNRVLRKCLEELAGYFQGCLRKFETPVDWAGQGTPFERRIWSRLRRIPYGKTASYGQLARSLCGRSALGPRAMGPRAVGQANGRNPVPILVPCHRVIAADGTLGGYSGGLEVKKALLELEGATVAGVEPS
ncbi:MAG: methylated-DNA--[protein]-cysteine S-methyltransferase [Planctomycetes bacterium]|nr:methylated-DNA--[protein]-cysteine S-methyltransferase [Planctomycetota bacterium]